MHLTYLLSIPSSLASPATVTPFSLLFRSDQFEVSAEASVGGRAGNAGFELVYVMDAVGCNAAET